MQFISAILWGLIEFVVIREFLLKSQMFQNQEEELEQKEIKKRKFCIGIFVLIALVCGWQIEVTMQSILECIKVCLIYVFFSLAALTDMKSYLIPNSFIVGLVSVRVILFIPEFILERELFVGLLKESLAGGVISLIVLLIISLITRGGLGMGDVKLLTAEGFIVGLYGVISTLLYALVCCFVCVLVLLATNKKKLRDKIPFAPFLYVGFTVSLLMGGL